jgi:hypothetical protein
MSVKSKKPLRKVIRSFPGGFALFLSVISISLTGILTVILVYSHFNYKNSQKELFIEKWDSIAGRISRDASLAISDAGLIDDDFASYLYWIPAVSKEIISIKLVDANNNSPRTLFRETINLSFPRIPEFCTRLSRLRFISITKSRRYCCLL